MTEKDFVRLSSLPGNAYLLTFAGNGEHRFNIMSFAAINRALDEVERDPNAAALVITNEGKFFSTGLDLPLVIKDPRLFEATVTALHKLLKRVLLFPMPVIAAICPETTPLRIAHRRCLVPGRIYESLREILRSGHATAAGCLLALAHDYRFMSADRGYIFLSEVDIKIPLTPGMNAVIHAKIPGAAFYKAVLSGHRFTAKSAVEHGFVNAALPDAASTLEEALKNAKALAARKFDRVIYWALKMEMFKTQVKELDEGGYGFVPAEDVLAKL